MSRGRLVVVSAPSGAGKTTIVQRVLEAHPDWRFSTSCTTRPIREHEVEGKDYIFLSDDDFDRYIEEGKFIEWEWVHNHRYGTLRRALNDALVGGDTLILDVDVKGGIRIKQQFENDTVAIFIEPPDLDTLARRLAARGTEDGEIIQKRLARIPEEMAYKEAYDYVVVNDDLEQAVAEVETILKENQ